MKRHNFPLFQTPLDLAHSYWKRLLKPGDCVVDATCGNGKDTLFLAQIVLDQNKIGCVAALDKQQQAIENTQKLLVENILENLMGGLLFYNQCHSSFPLPLEKKSVALIVYNLGYLPGGDKSITTTASTTRQSLEAAKDLIAPGGAISITCYPGHEAGKPEEEIALEFAASLDPITWSCCHHKWINRQNAPSLLFIQHSMEVIMAQNIASICRLQMPFLGLSLKD